jgi:biopolymer transport protein ExbB
MKLIRCIQMMILLALVAGYAGVSDAQTRWNDQWPFRKKIVFDTTAGGADIKEALSEVPFLVRLHAGNFNFTTAKEDGSGIRFVAADGQSVLKYHIEKYDPIDGLGLVWVRVPKIAGGSNQDHVWLYYGNRGAQPAQELAGTYDANYIGVYHLGEMEGLPKDSTNSANHAAAFAGGQGLPSLIGNGITLSGPGDRMTLPKSASMNLSSGLTFSAWVRTPAPQTEALLFFADGPGGAFRITVNHTTVCSAALGPDKLAVAAEVCAEMAVNTWQHLAVTAGPKAKLSLYLDGTEAGAKDLPGNLPGPGGDLVIGASPSGDRTFAGDLDEIRISNLARPASLIKAAFKAEGPEGKFAFYAPEEAAAAGGLKNYLGKTVDYLRIVAKATSLDGWLINGILAIMGAMSWVVFLVKAFMLKALLKENEAFRESYSEMKEIAGLSGSAEDFANSSLYRIYEAGCRELKTWESKGITAVVIASVKTALDRAFLRESQRLNAWLIILTTGITGGPFLGLLGTVWGIMNTFAAMVEVGEGNIMAMAPGVSSALTTTIAGLLVAIPSLFAYNYLVGKIRDITADNSVFIDEFALRVEHGGAE